MTDTTTALCACGLEGTAAEVDAHIQRMKQLPHNAGSDYHARTTTPATPPPLSAKQMEILQGVVKSQAESGIGLIPWFLLRDALAHINYLTERLAAREAALRQLQAKVEEEMALLDFEANLALDTNPLLRAVVNSVSVALEASRAALGTAATEAE